MRSLNNVEIISINTTDPHRSVGALRHSCTDIHFHNVKLLSHTRPNNISNDIQYIEIPKFTTRNEYSKFCLFDLFNYITSDYVLMIHSDGFIINPNMWSDEFLEYDYIGAPWPKRVMKEWNSTNRVGNGGFCLRSKRLIDYLPKISHSWETISKQKFNEDYVNEDAFISTNEILLHKFKFAPIELAMRFSYELPIEEHSSCNYDLTKFFGFHGRHTRETYDMVNNYHAVWDKEI